MWDMPKLHRTPAGMEWDGDVTTDCGLSGSFCGSGSERTTSMYVSKSGLVFEAQSADNEEFSVTCNRCRFGNDKSKYITVYIKDVRVRKNGGVVFDSGYLAISQKRYEEEFAPEVREVLDAGGIVMTKRSSLYGYGRVRMRPPSMSRNREAVVLEDSVLGAAS